VRETKWVIQVALITKGLQQVKAVSQETVSDKAVIRKTEKRKAQPVGCASVV